MKWTKERSAQAHAAKEKIRIQRAESVLNEPELVRVPCGEYLGSLRSALCIPRRIISQTGL